jgi:hypothetical protein
LTLTLSTVIAAAYLAGRPAENPTVDDVPGPGFKG